MWNLRRQRDIIESLVFRSFVDFQNVLLAPGDFVLKETKLWKSSWHCTMIQSANYSNRFHRNLPSSAVIWSSILCHRNSNSVVWESYGLITSIALPQPQSANNLPGFRHSCHHQANWHDNKKCIQAGKARSTDLYGKCTLSREGRPPSDPVGSGFFSPSSWRFKTNLFLRMMREWETVSW